METTPRFTEDWFSVWIPTWEKHVLPRISTVTDARWLEVGSFEGRSAIWTMNNLLLGEQASLVCVDPFYPQYEPTFDANLSGFSQMKKFKGKSDVVLPKLLALYGAESFHGVYLDGSHEEIPVLVDASMAWCLLKPGGVLVFDDYGNEEYPEVKKAVDVFLSRSDVHCEVLYKGGPTILYPNQSSWQVIVVKSERVVETPSEKTTFPALLARARERVTPTTIIDIGASNGCWSLMAYPHWPKARYFLIEANPVFKSNLRAVCENNPAFDYVVALAGASDGMATCHFNKDNPFQGIVLGDSPDGEVVESTTVDNQVRKKNLAGPYLLKFDVHGHELAILQGAVTTLLNTCAVIMEVYGWRQCVGSLRFWEMCAYLEYLGFRCTDLCDPLYRPYDNRLSQVDMLFERTNAPGMNSSRWT